MNFDIEGARKAGYSDSEIADYMAQSKKFDATGARNSGYSDSEIINHLSDRPIKQDKSTLPVFVGSGASGVNHGFYSDLIGFPVDTATNAIDLAKAGIGYLTSKITDKAPPDWTAPMDRSKVIGTSAWLDKNIYKNLFANPNPDSSIGRVIYGAGRAAGSSVSGSPKVTMPMGAAAGLSGSIAAEIDPRYAPVAAMIPQLAVAGAQSAAPFIKDKIAKQTENLKNFIEARQKGYVVPPTEASGGFMNSALGALSGKVKTEQKGSSINQPIFQKEIRKSLGISEDTPLNADTFQQLRRQHSAQYEKIKNSGIIKTDDKYLDAINKIGEKYNTAARDFPELADTGMINLTKALQKKEFGADSALNVISDLREKADKSYRAGDPSIGRDYKAAANALEDVVGRNLENKGQFNLLNDWRKSRENIAKTYSAQKAVNNNGMVVPKELKKQLDKGIPLTGELKQIAEFASRFPKYAQAVNEPNKYSILDAVVGLGGGLLHPGIAAMTASRPMVRSVILSNPYQNMLIKNNGLLDNAILGISKLPQNENYGYLLPFVGNQNLQR